MTLSRFLVVFLLGVLLAPPVMAQWHRIPSAAFSVPAPPAPGSAEDRRDFARLLQAQDERTASECALARSQRFASFDVLFRDSGLLSATEFERVESLMEKAAKLTVRIAGFYKGRYLRPRPSRVDDRIEPCAPVPAGDKAYPSSHAALASVGACLLAQIFPDRADEIVAYGDTIADLRYIVGVHHPSDIAAGKKLGQDVCHRLLTEDDFLNHLNEVR